MLDCVGVSLALPKYATLSVASYCRIRMVPGKPLIAEERASLHRHSTYTIKTARKRKKTWLGVLWGHMNRT